MTPAVRDVVIDACAAAKAAPPRARSAQRRVDKHELDAAQLAGTLERAINKRACSCAQRQPLPRALALARRAPADAWHRAWRTARRATASSRSHCARSTRMTSAKRSASNVSARPVEVLVARHEAERRRRRACARPRAALDDPLQHAHVLAEARPEELAVGVLAEPVDAEDARRMRDRACPSRASARSSRRCGSRRTAASRTGRGARRRPRRRPRRSSPSPWSRPCRRRPPSCAPRRPAARCPSAARRR